MRKIIVYKSVFDRNTFIESDFDTYLNNPINIFKELESDFDSVSKIYSTEDKQSRNDLKRELLPAMDLSQSGILAIDIDGIYNNDSLKNRIIDRLQTLDHTYVIKESVSGNIVAFFKYDCSVLKYPFLYYKLYLELTILLGVNIDFLPEIGRLRYVGDAGFIYKNDESSIVTEIIEVDSLPYIKTSVSPNRARGIKYGSR